MPTLQMCVDSCITAALLYINTYEVPLKISDLKSRLMLDFETFITTGEKIKVTSN